MYQFQEYPKWVNGKVVKSREEEELISSEKENRENAQGLCEDEGQIQTGGNGGQVSEEKSFEDLELKESKQPGDEKARKRRPTEEEYPQEHSGITIFPDEVHPWGFKCSQCNKEFNWKYKNSLIRHKIKHDVAKGLKPASVLKKEKLEYGQYSK